MCEPREVKEVNLHHLETGIADQAIASNSKTRLLRFRLDRWKSVLTGEYLRMPISAEITATTCPQLLRIQQLQARSNILTLRHPKLPADSSWPGCPINIRTRLLDGSRFR